MASLIRIAGIALALAACGSTAQSYNGQPDGSVTYDNQRKIHLDHGTYNVVWHADGRCTLAVFLKGVDDGIVYAATPAFMRVNGEDSGRTTTSASLPGGTYYLDVAELPYELFNNPEAPTCTWQVRIEPSS